MMLKVNTLYSKIFHIDRNGRKLKHNKNKEAPIINNRYKMAYDNDTTIRLSMTDSNFDEYVEVDVTQNKYTSRSNIIYTKLMHIDNQQKIYQNETFKNDYCSEDEFDDSM